MRLVSVMKGVLQDGQGLRVTKSVPMAPMVITVSRNVAVTVSAILHVTNRQVIVMVGVNQDIQTMTVAKSVRLGNLDWPASNVVASIV